MIMVTKEPSNIAPAGLRYLIAGFLLLAVLPLPYGYYMFLCVVVFFVFGFYFLQFREKANKKHIDLPWWVWAIGGFALLFNPFFPAHLMRPVWAIFNVAGAYLIYKTIKWEKDLAN